MEQGEAQDNSGAAVAQAKTVNRPRLLTLGGLIAMASSMGIGRFIYTPILPPMVQALDLTTGQAGLIASANFLGYFVGALGAASPRLPGSPHAWLLTALAVSAVTTGAMGFADTMRPFLWLRFLGGAASAFALVFASALVLERLSAAGRSDLSAWHFAGVGTGIALSALLTWGLEVGGGGWRWMWFGGGLLSLAALAAVAGLVPGLRHRPATPVAASARGAQRRLWPLVLAYGLFGFGYVITATFIVAIVRGAPEARSIEPMVWLVVGVAAIPSVAAWSAVGRRLGVVRAFGIACIVEAVGVLASVVWVSVPGLFLAAAFLGGTFMGITALGLIAVRNLSGEDPRRSLAMMTAAFGLGQIVGPVVAGYGHDLTGSFLLGSVMAAAALCISCALTIPMARATRDPSH